MKFDIQREVFLQPLSQVVGVVERKQTLPVLANFLISARGGEVTVSDTDMEVELISSVKQENRDSADITVPAKKLLDICRALPDDASITIKIAGDKAQVLSSKSRFTLSTLPSHEFPIIDMSEPAAEFEISQSLLK